MTRYLERIDRVFDAVAKAKSGSDMVGFCLDTCHAHAGGNALETVVEDVLKVTGRIDLVHCNDSRDEFDSGADRHANFGAGRIDPDLLAAVVRDADAPVICETPEERPSTSPTSPSSASACDAEPPPWTEPSQAPARRSPPAGSCRSGHGAGTSARSTGFAGRRRASPRRDTDRRRAAPWWASASCAAACWAPAHSDAPRRARIAARACRDRSPVPGSSARIAASRRTAWPTPCCRHGR